MPYSRLYYHIIWGTKHRLPLITEVNRQPIYAAIRAKVAAMGGMTHALNGPSDHVHLVATVPPNMSVARFIGQVKGNSSHLAARLDGGTFAWQAEYGVLSISESHLSTVMSYVVAQQQHHASSHLNERLERIGGDVPEGDI